MKEIKCKCGRTLVVPDEDKGAYICGQCRRLNKKYNVSYKKVMK
jgi:hypothetical protein